METSERPILNVTEDAMLWMVDPVRATGSVHKMRGSARGEDASLSPPAVIFSK